MCLLSLCATITGVFFQLLWGVRSQGWLLPWFLWGILASIGNIMIVWALSHQLLSNPQIVDEPGWPRRGWRTIAFIAVTAPIALLVSFGYAA